MKTKTMLFATVALAAAVASPALAQTTDWTQQRRFQNPYADAFGYSNGVRANGQRAINRPNDVYDTRGQYVGSDPDPTVRDQLARDPSQGD